MKKKIILSTIVVLLLVAGFFAWKFFAFPVSTEKGGSYLYIKAGSSLKDVQDELVKNKFVHSTVWFRMVSSLAGYKNIKPGRYKVTKGMSLVDLVRILKNGQQAPVNFVVTKIRTKEVLAQKVGAAFEFDSLQMINFLNDPDSLKNY